MNKYEIVFDMRKNKILFISRRYKYNNNKVSTSEDLSFLLITSFIIIISLKSTVENLNEESFDVNFSKDTRKRLTFTFKTFKEKMIQKFDFLNIVEIDVSIYYYLIRSKENKLFSLIMNKIYDIFIESFEILPSMKRDSRISVNDLCLYNFKIKYKKCCEFYIFKNSQINNIKILISQKVLSKFSIDYYNYVNVFDKL